MALLALLCVPAALAGGEVPVVYEGEPTDAFPDTVAVGVSDSGALVSLCTVVLVSEDTVLTAAHCLADLDVFVDAGLTAEVGLPGAAEDGGELRVAILEAVPHPEWDPEGEDRGFLRDVAVLHLAEAVPLAPAVLAEAPEDGWLGAELTLVGFGATGDDSAGSGTLRVVRLPVVEESGAVLRLYAEGAGNLCTGDSGGPAWTLADGQARLVGINVFTWQPDGGSGCEGGGTGTLLADEVWDWVEAEVEGRAWRPGCGACATSGAEPGWPGWVAVALVVAWGGRRRRSSSR